MSEHLGETPGYLRTSTAAALTLGLKKGRFYRNARLRCINLLQVYTGGCSASCAYCGLSGKRSKDSVGKSFIRVDWPVYSLDDLLAGMKKHQHRFTRICISMITRKRASRDAVSIIKSLKAGLDTPISVLISPTVTTEADLIRFKENGADKIGVAMDTATQRLFDKYRGKEVGGPHKWEKYRLAYKTALNIFGRGNVGIHLIAGLGETEQEMASTIQDSHDLGGNTHLFSFYPEKGSRLEGHEPPPIDRYRRIQLAGYLIDEGIGHFAHFKFNGSSRITSFGIPWEKLNGIIQSGLPFMTSGCTGRDGKTACNRPYANFPPPNIRNYPFKLSSEDLKLVAEQLQMQRGPVS